MGTRVHKVWDLLHNVRKRNLGILLNNVELRKFLLGLKRGYVRNQIYFKPIQPLPANTLYLAVTTRPRVSERVEGLKGGAASWYINTRQPHPRQEFSVLAQQETIAA